MESVGEMRPAMPTLQIRLLGDFQLLYRGELVTTVNQARQQSLLAYLVLHRDAPQARQQLAFLFWPDTTEVRALTNLRNLLYKLRQVLPNAEHLLWADTQTVQWRPNISYTIDVVEFEVASRQAVTQADLAQAVQLYRGDLLPSCYDDWIVPVREQLQQRAMAVLVRLLDLLEEARAYRTALGYGQELQRLDPINEDTYRRLMRLHAAAGDRAGALRVYQRCVTTLQEELAAPPSPATRELYQRLLAANAEPPSHIIHTQEHLPLVGRQSEWKLLLDAWYAASSGKASCLVLAGEAGIGKTRLAEELLSWVSRQGSATAAAHCYAAEGALAYAPVVAWLRSATVGQRLSRLEPVWLSEVARLLPELLVQQPTLPAPGPLTEVWQRQRLFEALARAVLMPGEPLLLLLDDLQWSDRDTLEWLHYLLRFEHPRGAKRLLLVGTVRSEEVTPDHPLLALLDGLHRTGQVTELVIGPLSATETTLLATTIAGHAPTSAQALRLYEETEGNALFVVETVRARKEQDTRLEAGPNAQAYSVVSRPPLPQKVQIVIQARLAQLSPPARELAGLAGAIGREFTFRVLAQASDQDEDTLVRNLDELWQRRIIRERGADSYDFSHDKLRDVAYSSLSGARRRLLHRRIAQALEVLSVGNPDAVSGQVAAHYELAGLLELAIPYYQRAGEVAQRVYANAEAIHYYERAVALLEGFSGHPQEATTLYERLGDLYHLIGQHSKAEAAYQQSLQRVLPPNPLERARLQRKIGNTYTSQRRYEQAIQTYYMALTALGPEQLLATEEWWHEWFEIEVAQMGCYYWQGQLENIQVLIEKTRPFVEQHGTPAQRAGFFHALVRMNLRRDRYIMTSATLEHVHNYLAAARESDNPAAVAYAIYMVGYCWFLHHELARAEDQMQSTLAFAQQVGDVALQTRCLTYLTITYRKRGAIEQVQRFVAQSLEAATAADMPDYIAAAKANEAWLSWRTGNLALAKEKGQVALTTWQSSPFAWPFHWLALWPLIAVALTQDDVTSAVEAAHALLGPSQLPVPDDLATLLEQVILAWDSGEPDLAPSLLQEALTLAQRLQYL